MQGHNKDKKKRLRIIGEQVKENDYYLHFDEELTIMEGIPYHVLEV